MTYRIAVYEVRQAYGGPEEGGWWYDEGALSWVYPKRFKNAKQAANVCLALNDKLHREDRRTRRAYTSVLSEGKRVAMMFGGKPIPGFPMHRPHYE